MTTITKHRGGPRLNFDLVRPEGGLDIFADGIGEVQIGPTYVRVMFYQIRAQRPEEGLSDPVETREVCGTIVMELVAFLEGFANVLAGAAANAAALTKANEERLVQIGALLRGITQTEQRFITAPIASTPAPSATAKKRIALRRRSSAG